jgi:hypothetical protein
LIPVHIEFQRVQTWLFAVPRLRAMVGANALIGEVLRVGLPALARETDRGWIRTAAPGVYPTAHADDPLSAHDDPAADAADGILSRDGGHFEALFTEGATAFAHAAGQLIRSRLPGLRFRVKIDGVDQHRSPVRVSTELPVLMPCEWTGRGLASTTVQQGAELPAVSLDVASRHDAATRAEQGSAMDLASLLSDATKLKALKRPHELEDLVGDGYLALIHADGNRVGAGVTQDSAADAAFFHRNRVLLRRALQAAIQAHCGDRGLAPILPLMLGGDDLLIVCRAETALHFVITLCDVLADLQKESSGFKLTLGVGVVIAKHTIPIHRLHDVAEQLATSAKRRFRGIAETSAPRSVVDWAVYSTAWVEDPDEVRRRDWLRGYAPDQRVLSQRPVDVLGDGLDTLAGLVGAADEVADAPRSQLRFLVEQLPRGKALSDLAFVELSNEAKQKLKNAGVEGPWRRASNGDAWLTPLLDLVEIAEISRLGSATTTPAAKARSLRVDVNHG